MKVPQHIPAHDNSDAAKLLRAMHAFGMSQLNPAGFRSPRKRKGPRPLTLMEQKALEAKLTTLKDIFDPKKTEAELARPPKRSFRQPVRVGLQKLPRWKRRNMLFGRNDIGNTTPDQRRKNKADTLVLLQIHESTPHALDA